MLAGFTVAPGGTPGPNIPPPTTTLVMGPAGALVVVVYWMTCIVAREPSSLEATSSHQQQWKPSVTREADAKRPRHKRQGRSTPPFRSGNALAGARERTGASTPSPHTPAHSPAAVGYWQLVTS